MMFEMIEAAGDGYLKEPHVKHIEGALWEIRAKARDGHGRAFYVTRRGRRLIVVHVINKKSAKTPKSALRTALSRIRELDVDPIERPQG